MSQTLTRYPVSPWYTVTLGWAGSLLCWSAHCLRVQLTPIDTPVYVLHHWHRSHGHTAGGRMEDWPPTEGGKLFRLDPTLLAENRLLQEKKGWWMLWQNAIMWQVVLCHLFCICLKDRIQKQGYALKTLSLNCKPQSVPCKACTGLKSYLPWRLSWSFWASSLQCSVAKLGSSGCSK